MAIRLSKNRLPPPPLKNRGGEGKAIAGVLGVRAGKRPGTSGGKNKARPPFTFVTAVPFGWRKSCRARVAVCKGRLPLGLGTNSRNYPSPNHLDLSTLYVCFMGLLLNFRKERPPRSTRRATTTSPPTTTETRHGSFGNPRYPKRREPSDLSRRRGRSPFKNGKPRGYHFSYPEIFHF
jgi:hypothetical protein